MTRTGSPHSRPVIKSSTYDPEHLPADFIGYVKALQAHAGHEPHAYRLARALQLRVRVGLHNYCLPEAQPDPLIVVQPWYFAWSNDVLRHEMAHVMLWWSGLESHILALYGPEAGWTVIERLCQQAVAFLHIPPPMLQDAVQRHGVSAQAVLHLQKQSGASLSTALRRLIYDTPDAQRAGFLTSGAYIRAVAQCNLILPFGWLDRVPEPLIRFPTTSRVTTVRLHARGLVGVWAE
ncbi:hypothetical protein D3875_15910 [Deinococcus cavernae]|uniref:Uncharacterized protein n=1 Tax=Deinococcus cavernae TaxID=2320857 RepID=A0A418V9T2_9DEIO|nr:hypothetical protein [Deinococcus cavernae]RJF72806.1 hypothetical protein D3875_15910 [Deinococcus cavernae]